MAPDVGGGYVQVAEGIVQMRGSRKDPVVQAWRKRSDPVYPVTEIGWGVGGGSGKPWCFV